MNARFQNGALASVIGYAVALDMRCLRRPKHTVQPASRRMTKATRVIQKPRRGSAFARGGARTQVRKNEGGNEDE